MAGTFRRMLTEGSPARTVIVSVAYFAAHQFASFHPDPQRTLMAVWLTAGIGLAALLATSRRHWPSLLAGMAVAGVLADRIAGVALVDSLGFMVADIAAPLFCALIIRHRSRKPTDFSDVGSVLTLIISVSVVSGVAAVVGAGTRTIVAGGLFWSLLWEWWISHGLGMLLFTPLLLAGLKTARSREAWLRMVRPEEIILFVLWVTIIWLTFAAPFSRAILAPRPYLFIAMLFYCVLRCGTGGVSFWLVTGSLLIAGSKAIAIGPFFHGTTVSERLLELQSFMAALACSGYLMTAGISQRKRVESQLRSLFDSSPDGIILLDCTMQIMDANAAACTIYGYPRDELLKMKITDISAEPEKTTEAIRRRAVSIPARYHRKKDGTVFPAEISGGYFSLGGKTYHTAFIRAVTERRQTGEHLLESEERFRSLVTMAPDGIFVNCDGKFSFLNPAMLKLLGTDRELVGTPIFPWIAPEYHTSVLERMAFQNETGRAAPLIDMQYLRADGSRVHVETAATPIKFRDCDAHLVFVRDITERKRSEEKYRDLFNNAEVGMFRARLDGSELLDCNEKYLEIFGRTREEMIGRPSVMNWADPAEREELLRRLIADTRLLDFQCKMFDNRGRVRHCLASVRLYRDLDIMEGSLLDITPIKEAEESRLELEKVVLQSQRLESLGVLAGGIAHDFNNMLAGIYGYMEMAKAALDDPPPEPGRAVEHLEKALSVFDRTKNLTRQLLTFAKGGAPVKRGGDITTLIRETAQFILTGSNVSLECCFPRDLWPCEFDVTMMEQVFDNLVINAHQAMPDGGSIFCTAENVVLEQHEIAGLKPGRYVRFAVRDTGSGIPPEILSKIFDPFFTTKETGTGLGLATAYSIVKKHGGHISVTSEIGRGTTFFVMLPATDLAPFVPEIGKEGCRNRTGNFKSLRVLVMDDEKYLRDVVSEMLCGLGCTISVAIDGKEALALVQEGLDRGIPFACILMDLTIPGRMGGREAIGRLRSIDQSLVAIAMSGYSDDAVMADPIRYGFQGSIAKPFMLDTLIKELTRHF